MCTTNHVSILVRRRFSFSFFFVLLLLYPKLEFIRLNAVQINLIHAYTHGFRTFVRSWKKTQHILPYINNNKTLARVRIMCLPLCIIRNFLQCFVHSFAHHCGVSSAFHRNVRKQSSLDLLSANPFYQIVINQTRKFPFQMHWLAIQFTTFSTPTQICSLFLDAWTSFRFDCMNRCWFISTASTSHAHLTSLGFLLQFFFFFFNASSSSVVFISRTATQKSFSFSLSLSFSASVFGSTPFIWFENALNLAEKHFVLFTIFAI